MLGRYAFSIVVGTAITFSLLFVMHLLIEHAEDAISKERTRHQLDFVRVRRNETLNTEDYTPEKPPPPPEVPPEVPPQDMDSIDPNAPTINVPPPSNTPTAVPRAPEPAARSTESARTGFAGSRIEIGPGTASVHGSPV